MEREKLILVRASALRKVYLDLCDRDFRPWIIGIAWDFGHLISYRILSRLIGPETGARLDKLASDTNWVRCCRSGTESPRMSRLSIRIWPAGWLISPLISCRDLGMPFDSDILMSILGNTFSWYHHISILRVQNPRHCAPWFTSRWQ